MILIISILTFINFAVPLNAKAVKKIGEIGITHYTTEESLNSINEQRFINPTTGKKAYSTGGIPCVFFFLGHTYTTRQRSFNKYTTNKHHFIHITNISSISGRFYKRYRDNAIIYCNDAEKGMDLKGLDYKTGKRE